MTPCRVSRPSGSVLLVFKGLYHAEGPHVSRLRQVEAYLKDMFITDSASVWAMARRSPGYGHDGSGVCLGDGQTEAYLKDMDIAGLASVLAMARRRPICRIWAWRVWRLPGRWPDGGISVGYGHDGPGVCLGDGQTRQRAAPSYVPTFDTDLVDVVQLQKIEGA